MQKNKNILDRMRLDGKVALITGAGQGLGEGFCHALGEAGAKVAVVDCIRDRSERVAHELNKNNIESLSIVADITQANDVDKMIKQIIEKWGRLDIAINNAGIGKNSAAELTTELEWDSVFKVNLSGVFLCCQKEAQIMFKSGYGKIINVASMSSLIVPHPQKQAAYNTSKAGVVQLTKSLACEWADRGIRVNCISPGIIQTAMIETPELKPLVAEWLNQIPAKRLASVADIQGAIVFLSSEASDYITGHNLVADGGHTLW